MYEIEISPTSITNGYCRSITFSFKNPTDHDMRNLAVFFKNRLIGFAENHFVGANRWGVKIPVAELGLTDFPIDRADSIITRVRSNTVFMYEEVK